MLGQGARFGAALQSRWSSEKPPGVAGGAVSVPQSIWLLDPGWGSLPRATSCCRARCASLPRPCSFLQPSSCAQPLVIRLGGAGCSSQPADELAIGSSIARLRRFVGNDILPSASANSAVPSLHPSPPGRALQETRAPVEQKALAVLDAGVCSKG